jgi:hypothetical protein
MHGWIQFKESITVRTETLEAFARQRSIKRIDFIHMDVQGAERLVLLGAASLLPRIGAIWLEVSDEALYKGQALKGEIARFMAERGFSLAHEVMNGVEGDQLYVNRRFPRSWGYLAYKRAGAFLRRARFRAGALKSRVLGRTS